jgi:2-keto-4-pentenoate hydratase
MMNLETNTATAAVFLRNLWRQGDVCAGLPSHFHISGRHQAYAVQAEIGKESGAPLKAWKIAATSTAGQAHIGVSRPLAGRYIAEQCVEDGGTIPFGHNRMRVAEVEFAFRFAHDVEPRARQFTEADLASQIASLHPAIEIPDSRYEKFEAVGEVALIADNACGHWLCLGKAMPESWRETDLVNIRPVGRINGKNDVEGLGRNVLGGPLVALAWFVNEMSWLGVTVRKDQYVTTGTCLVPMPVQAGDEVTGDFGSLGTVKVHLGS